MSALRDTTCPLCGKFCDAVSGVESSRVLPKDGDYNVCIGCHGVSVFDSKAEGGARHMTEEETAAAMQHETLAKLIRIMGQTESHA